MSYNNAWYTLGGGLGRKAVNAKSYTPFGEQIGEATSGYGYNGEYYSAATGMIYLRARFYAPEMNRFSQKDTLRGSVTQPGSLNRYLYCQNDPVNFVDPSGMRQVAGMYGDGTGRTSTAKQTTPIVTKPSQSKVSSAAAASRTVAVPVTDTGTGGYRSPAPPDDGATGQGKQGPTNHSNTSHTSNQTNGITREAPGVELLSRTFYCNNPQHAETTYIMFSNNPQYDDANHNSDYTDAMYYQLHKALSEGKNVVITVVNTKREFAAAWDNLPENSVIPEVYMIFHSNGHALILEEGSRIEGYSGDGRNITGEYAIGNISELPERQIDTLYLLGCNTGVVDRLNDGKSNIAADFSSLTSGRVIGVDGELAFGAPSIIVDDEYNVFFPRLAQEQDQNPKGYVEYINGDYKVIGGLATPLEALWEWVLMHENDDIDEWRNR